MLCRWATRYSRALRHYQLLHRSISYDAGRSALSLTSKPEESLRSSYRGGLNLSERYLHLEISLRGKADLSKSIGGNLGASLAHVATEVQPGWTSPEKPVQLFHGFAIPQEPKAPADDECCMSGCAVCVYDLYEDSLAEYKAAVLSLRNSLSALAIPELDWPPNIRIQGLDSVGESEKRRNTILSVFEEMERNITRRKQESDA